MVVDQAKGMASFENQVVALKDGQTLKADRLEIYFTPGMKGILKMVCLGNVKAVQGEGAPSIASSGN